MVLYSTETILNIEKMDKTNNSITKPQNTQLINSRGLFGINHLFIKDESKHPTFTFKDRMAYEMIRPYINSPRRVTFIAISYGNLAISMGYYINKLNRVHGKKAASSITFIPNDLKFWNMGPDTEERKISGKEYIKLITRDSKIIELDLEQQFYDTQKLIEVLRKHRFKAKEIINVSEGLHRPCYFGIYHEIIRDLKRPPDFLIVPYGSGTLCNEMIDTARNYGHKTRIVPVSVTSKNSIADKLWGPWWVDIKSLRKYGKGLTKRQNYSYYVYRVDDDEILEAMDKLRGVTSAEPSGAAGFAILHRLKEIANTFDPKRDYVVVINTGNGLRNFYAM